MRILITDDSVFMRSAIGRVLAEQPDFEIVGKARNGLEAVELAKELRPDVITMDIEMPEMDGLEAARRINRDHAEGARPRIIAMAANAMQGDREMCLAAGMDDYIAKPIRVDRLIEALLAVPAHQRDAT